MDDRDWVRVEEFPAYFVNRKGEFKRMTIKGRPPLQESDELGNPLIRLRHITTGEPSLRRIDRIVARAFVDSGDSRVDRYPIHIDDDPSNCRAENLRWE